MQLGYQSFNAGSFTPASYTNLQEVMPAPATASGSANYQTAVAIVPGFRPCFAGRDRLSAVAPAGKCA